ncbi:MAG: ArsR family transcriptional regulator [Ilumatobacteraceae bacterium]
MTTGATAPIGATPGDRSGGSAAGGVAVPPPLPSGRRAVLYAVRQLGDGVVGDIAEHVGITVSGARQHLDALIAERLVATSEIRAASVAAADRRSRTTSPSSPTRCSRRRTGR